MKIALLVLSVAVRSTAATGAAAALLRNGNKNKIQKNRRRAAAAGHRSLTTFDPSQAATLCADPTGKTSNDDWFLTPEGICYYDSNTALTWEHCSTFCHYINAEMPCFANSGEEDDMAKLIEEERIDREELNVEEVLAGNFERHVWLNRRADPGEDEYLYDTCPQDYANSELEDGEGDCLQWTFDASGTKSWKKAKCGEGEEEEITCVCTKDNVERTPTFGDCLSGEVEVDGHCFKGMGSHKTFTQCEDACGSLEGATYILPCITSVEMNNDVGNAFPSGTWLSNVFDGDFKFDNTICHSDFHISEVVLPDALVGLTFGAGNICGINKKTEEGRIGWDGVMCAPENQVAAVAECICQRVQDGEQL